MAKKHKFSSPEEEIYFFKDLKPLIISRIIQCKTVLNIVTNLPTSKKNKIIFYEDALNLIQENTNKNRKFMNIKEQKLHIKLIFIF